MSVGRFFGRVADAAISAMPSVSAAELADRLDTVVVGVAITDEAADVPGHAAGFLAVVNVISRLYPRIVLGGADHLVAAAAEIARSINPHIELSADPDTVPTASVTWGTASNEAHTIGISARGWHVELDTVGTPLPTANATALAAAALAASELFNFVFADLVAAPRTSTRPTSWSVITLTGDDHPYDPAAAIDIGRLGIVGCGALGEAFVAALDDANVTGIIVAIDHEPVDLSNLQRYFLATDTDIDVAKTSLVKRQQRDGLDVDEVTKPWSADLADTVDTVIVALDTPEDRIAVQASLPAAIFNAYTGLAELGVSRHEHFGTDMCLACLYWPLGAPPRPRHELIGEALGVDADRVLLYSLNRIPVGLPLPGAAFVGRAAVLRPETILEWTQRAVLDDIAADRNAPPAAVDAWRGAQVDDLYIRGVCGGAWAELSRSEGARGHVVVPLAHESLMGGALLAAQLFAARSTELRDLRPEATHVALNLRNGTNLPRRDVRPPTPGCLCADPDYANRYQAKHGRP